jgi:hypothetical protein
MWSNFRLEDDNKESLKLGGIEGEGGHHSFCKRTEHVHAQGGR